MLSLTLFGAFRVELEGEAQPFASNAARALLAYLAVDDGRARSREEVAALFWPDKSQKAAYLNLRQAILRVRAALSSFPDNVLETSQQTIRFVPSAAVEVDAAQFETLLAANAAHAHADILACPDCLARLGRAAHLYRGDFLQGLLFNASQTFEEWLLVKRDYYRQQAIHTFYTLGQHHLQQADYARARNYAERQLALEPWLEEAHAQLMRALACAGQRAAALAQYQTCCRVLQDELGIEPGNDLRVLYERIQSGDLQPVALNARPPRHNLPKQLTPFIGREDELADITRRLTGGEERLLTLRGLGGMGKTRLALEAARARIDDFADGVFFISLAPLMSANDIVPAICAAIGVFPNINGADTRQALLTFLADKRALLVLDNFEHILSGADVVTDILHGAPNVQVIITSREPLQVRGEHALVVGGMAFSEHDATSPAMRLFEQCARRARAGFALDPSNAANVARICQLVEGMPLALELAAAWLETLPLHTIVAEIERRADFLAADWRDSPERQRSIQAVFEWSWRLLNEHEQRVFCQLSVFRGGFTFQAAECVVGASLRALAGLIHKSLVRRDEGDGVNARYGVHELLRQFAAEKLAAIDAMDAVMARALRERHGMYYLTFAGEQAAALYSGAPSRAVADVQTDIDNIRQACEWAVDHAQIKLLHDHTPALSSIYLMLGLWHEAKQLLLTLLRLAERKLADPGAEGNAIDQRLAAALAAKALVEQARYLVTGELYQHARVAIQSALEHAQNAQDIDSQAGALLYWAETSIAFGDVEEGQSLLERALDLTQGAPPYHAPEPGRGTPVLKAMILAYLAVAAVHQKRYLDAHEYGEQGLRICADAADWLGGGRVAANLGMGHANMGRYGHARKYHELALRLLDQVPNSVMYVLALQEVGRASMYCGDFADADLRFQSALTACCDFGNTPGEMRALNLLSRLAYYRDLYVTACDYARQGARLARAQGDRHSEGVGLCHLGDGLMGLRRWDEAADAYRQSLVCFDALGDELAGAEPKAGLAEIALAEGNLAEAQRYVEDILRVNGDNRRVGLDEPFHVCLVCHCVLKAAKDPRAASVLGMALALLAEYAEDIPVGVRRQSFLEKVPTHLKLQMVMRAEDERVLAC